MESEFMTFCTEHLVTVGTVGTVDTLGTVGTVGTLDTGRSSQEVAVCGDTAAVPGTGHH